jgi:AcrR family transcriptional regulator
VLGSPKRDRQAERREATKVEILAAAWDVCRRTGLAGLSLREVGRQVGLQAPSLYSYFPSKNAIYDAMFAEGCAAFVAKQPELPDDPLAGVRLLLRYYVDFCTADPVRHQLLFQRTIPGFEPSPESFEITLESIHRISDWMLHVGFGTGALDLYTAIGSGLAAQQNANDPGGDRWTRLVDTAAEMFVSHMERTSPSLPPSTTSHRQEQS